MFGASNNAFSGFGNNNQQQQQQPQQPASLFGAAQPSTPFNAFGQQNNPAPFSQAQPTGFGTNAFGTSAPATGFGSTPAPANVFGQPQAQPNSSLFGASAQPQAAPATGFGGFGAAAAPATNTFGAFSGGATNNSTGTGLFGQKPAAPATTFGAGNTAFTPNVFGQNAAAPFGAAANPSMPNGTANPPYAPVTLAENESTPSQKSTFNSIVAMDAYKNMSFEELRFQDYSQGRKTAAPANAMAAGFGSGQQQGQMSFSPFNNNNSNPAQVGGFGQQPAQGGLFGSTPATSAFGTQAPSTNNMFGQAATNNPTPFGQAQNTTNPSPFGAPAAQPTNTFGSNNLFNNSSNTTPFGAQPAKPNMFGSGTTNNAFGQPPTSTAPTNSLFGSTPAQPQSTLFGATNQNQTTGGGLFGNNNNSNSQPTGGLFGNNNQNNTQKPGGLFGSSTNTTGTSLFGQPAQQPPNSNNLFGFSQNNQQPQQTGGLFGGNNQQQQANSGGLFGMNNNQQNQAGTGGGLFGNNNANTNNQNNALGNTAGGGLFSNNNQTGGGLFGQKPLGSTGSLFGNKDNATQNNNNTFGNSTGGGLFGNSQNNSQGFGFASNNNNNANAGNNGLFGSMNNSNQNQMNNQNGLFQSQQNQQPTLQARIDQDAYGNNPLFANHGISSGGSRPAIPIKKQLPSIDFKPLPRPNTRITKLRGFARSTSPVKTTGGGSTMGASTASNNASVVSRSSAYIRANEEPLLSPKAFIVKPSPKKLTIDPATLSTLFRNRSSTLNGSPGLADGAPPQTGPQTQSQNRISTRSAFDPDAEASAQDLFSRPPQTSLRSATASQLSESGGNARGVNAPNPNNTVRSSTSPTRRTVQSEQEPAKDHAIMEDEVVVSTKGKAQEGEYWTVPSIDELCMMSRVDLEAMPNFTAGRVGYGQIAFQREVDLSGIRNLREGLCGSVIVFKQSICSVYPEDPVDKPPVGQGLNVPAVITLENCWAQDKATRAPLKEPNHPRVKLFMKRLMKIEGTEFIDYDALNGRWTFAVQHFTTYGIDESDGEGSEDDDELTPSDEGTDATDSETSATFLRQARRAGQASRRSKLLRSALDEDEEEDGPPRAMLFDDEEEEEQAEELYERTGRRGEMHDEETTASVTGSDEVDRPAKQRLVTKKRPRQGTEGEDEDEDDDGDTDEQDSEWQSQVGAESRKLAVMQASLFARPDQVRGKGKAGQTGLAKSGTRVDLAKVLKPLREEPQKKQQQRFRQQTPLAQTVYQQPKGKKASAVGVKMRHPKHIPLTQSLANRKEASVVDMPMSMARSFRVSWVGHSDRVVHLGRGSIGNMIGSHEEESSFGDLAIRNVPTHAFELEQEIRAAERLLEVQLKHTTIRLEDGVPLAETQPTLRFRDFQARYEKTDRSSDANIWSLCGALFDEIELAIPAGASGEVAERIRSIRREDAFSGWLERVVGPSVEQDVRGAGRQGGGAAIFRLLTGNQIERACEAAIETGHFRLATLIAQCGRSDGTFKADMRQQMATWRELRVDGLMDRELRKVYELLAGNTMVARGFGKKGVQADWSEQVMIAEQLDWKRALGLHIWFPAAQDNFWYGVQTYEQAFKAEGSAPAPVPWYVEHEPEGSKRQWKATEPVYDGLYQIVKMFVDPTYALETVLEPRGFGPSPFDYRMSWHLYRMIGRVLKVREFEDRELILGDMDEMEEVEEGGSLRADLVTSRYAEQLVRMGEWKWAVFVYLHLEQAGCREEAVQKLIGRNIEKIDSETEEFIVEKLKVPLSWIYAARAERAHYEGRLYDQVGWLKKAGRFADAHRIVFWELAPEGVIKGDLKLVGVLFEGLSSENVADWATGGKVFLEYVAVMEHGTRLVRALARPADEQSELSSEDEDDAAGMLEETMGSLLKEIPGMYVEGMGREALRMKHRVCVNEMMAGFASLVSGGIGSRVDPDGGLGIGGGPVSVGGRGAAGTGEKVVWVQRWARSGLDRAVHRACGAAGGVVPIGSNSNSSGISSSRSSGGGGGGVKVV